MAQDHAPTDPDHVPDVGKMIDPELREKVVAIIEPIARRWIYQTAHKGPDHLCAGIASDAATALALLSPRPDVEDIEWLRAALPKMHPNLHGLNPPEMVAANEAINARIDRILAGLSAALLPAHPDVGTVEAAYREGYKDGFDRAVYEGEGPNPDLGWKLSDASHAPAQLERPGTADWQEVIERAIALIESEYPNQGPREPETRLRHDLRAMLAATPPSPEPNWLAMAQRAYEAQMADIHPAFARACTWDELAEIDGAQDKWVRVVKAAVGGMG